MNEKEASKIDMHRCPKCNKLIMNSWTTCPYCNPGKMNCNPIKTRSKNKNVFSLIAYATFGFIFLYFIGAMIFGDRTEEDVKNSVEKYLFYSLKDHSSEKTIQWYTPSKETGIINYRTYNYLIRYKYYAKNSFGIDILNDQIFYLDKNYKIVFVQELP